MRLKFAVFVGLWMPLAAGCALMGRRGPAPADLAAARDLSLRGTAALERGEWERAESLLRKSLETTPADAESRRYLAEALWRRGATDEALTQIAAAQREDSSDAVLTVRAGEMMLALGRIQPALAQANQAVRLDPSMTTAWALRGRVFWHLHQPDRALADLHHSLEFAPNHRDVLLDLADIYRQIGQPTRSLTTLHRLLDTYSPGEEPQQVLLMQGLTLHELGRPRQAAESLWVASRRDPPNAEVFCALAQVQATLGDYGSATASAEQALAVDAAHAPSRQLLAQLAGRTSPSDPQRR